MVDSSMEFKDYIKAGATLFAAFLGATFAFRLNDNKEKRKESLKNKESLNFAMFTLARQANAISTTKNGFSRFNSEFELAFNMPAYKNPEYKDLIQNFDDLAFILESGDPQTLMDLTVEQERFEQAMSAISIRNEFYVNEFQPLLEKHKLNKRRVTAEEAEALLGERVFNACIQGATEMKGHVFESEISLLKMHKKLFEMAKELYPGHSFVKWENQA